MASKETVALCPGSFDPPTMGHVDIIARASEIFPKVIVAIGHSPNKASLFTVEEKHGLLMKAFGHLKNVEIQDYSGLTVDYDVQEDLLLDQTYF